MSDTNQSKIPTTHYRVALVLSQLSQKELAAKLGVSAAFLSGVINNKRFDYSRNFHEKILAFIRNPQMFNEKL